MQTQACPEASKAHAMTPITLHTYRHRRNSNYYIGMSFARIDVPETHTGS
jgi:hypothetical protein